MTDLRQAAEMALEALELGDDISAEQMSDALDALRQALAQPEQEPVVGMFEEKLPDQNPPPWSRSYRLKRDWVGLTDEEIEKCKIDGGLPHTVNWRLSAKIMQAKLKEKNT